MLNNKKHPHIKVGTNNVLGNGKNSPILYLMKQLLVLHAWGKDGQGWTASAPSSSRVPILTYQALPKGLSACYCSERGDRRRGLWSNGIPCPKGLNVSKTVTNRQEVMKSAWANPKYLIKTPYTGREYDATNTFVRISIYCFLGYLQCPHFWEALYYGPDDCTLSVKRKHCFP